MLSFFAAKVQRGKVAKVFKLWSAVSTKFEIFDELPPALAGDLF